MSHASDGSRAIADSNSSNNNILITKGSSFVFPGVCCIRSNKGSLTASVKPHACKMYVLTFSPYSHTSPLDWIYDTFGIPLCDKKH
jgi:hypothetical protein